MTTGRERQPCAAAAFREDPHSFIARAMSPALITTVAPAVFVVIWSSGWIVAKYAAPHADPLTFLSVRFALAAALIGAFCLVMQAPRPRNAAEAGHMLLSGVLIHALYLGGVWYAVAHGVPAGISALLAALQPLMSAALSQPLSGERISMKRWVGVVVGLLGIGLVLQPRLSGIALDRLAIVAFPLIVNVFSMMAVTLGTFHQKRMLKQVDLRTLAAFQFVGAGLAIVPLALLTEPLRIEWVPETFAALAWSVLVLSVVAIGLMLMLIRRGSVAKLAALIYLVPPVAAVQAYLLFGETLSPIQLFGMAVVAVGVFLATRD
jgi:drug/metabolite transporter (DMT)-like permease